MEYPVEAFSEEEKARLAHHFTNLDRPVFALVGLPETVKGALFARYSRYQGTLRRLYLDEFAGDVAPAAPHEGEGERARQLYERIFLGYGDDSVAQLGGAHIACEWVSNVMTKLLQRGRLAAYLEQSTRYIPYDAPVAESLGYRYWRHTGLGPEYERTMDFLFRAYAEALPRVEAWAAERFPRPDGEPEAAHRRAIRAKALDLLRGLLPAASLSHMGIFATGQAYEQLLLRLYASPLPEARDYADMILAELKAVMPSFVARVERPERGGEWISYLEERGAAAERALRPGGGAPRLGGGGGGRRNRRHRPGRGFEVLRYRFEIVSDSGAFRDLQRHRMLTVQWQALGPELGAGVPGGLEDAGGAHSYREGLERSRAEHARIAAAGRPELAPYALCLGYPIRYVLDMNAREAMHLIELRSGREGPPTYRAVAHELHAQIARVHPAVAAAMTHVDAETEPRLERILSEIRTQARREAARAGR